MLSNPSSARRGSAGYSLIELLVVVGIIAIAAAMMAPNVAGYLRNYRIRGAAQQVASQLQTARARAIGKNVNLGVVFVARQTTSAWVMEDDLLPNTGGSTDWFKYADVNLTTLLANRTQSPGWVGLPDRVELASPVDCGAAAPTRWGLRFSRLGTQCAVGSTADCPVPGSSAYTPLLVTADTNGNALLCLVDRQNGLRRRISVSAGGRVAIQSPTRTAGVWQ